MNPFQTHAVARSQTEDSNLKSVTSATSEPRLYRTPKLHRIGAIEQMQGRNFYSDKDLGNDNYYT